jgi:hypothetical protein
MKRDMPKRRESRSLNSKPNSLTANVDERTKMLHTRKFLYAEV